MDGVCMGYLISEGGVVNVRVFVTGFHISCLGVSLLFEKGSIRVYEMLGFSRWGRSIYLSVHLNMGLTLLNW